MKDSIFDDTDRIVSFDVVSLYTNIPLAETIDAVYAEESKRVPPVPKGIFKKLLKITSYINK